MFDRLPMSFNGDPLPPSWTVVAPRWPQRLVLLTIILASIAIGAGLGVGLTALTTRSDAIGARRIGPWRLQVDAGTPSINPYLRGHFARRGQIPLATAQGLTAVARYDSAGKALDRGCAYRITGPMPQALFWTIEAADLVGAPFETPARRQSFTSEDVLRNTSGQFAIMVASEVQPGNWLPLAGSGRFILVLRLYETPLAGSVTAGDGIFPTIETVRCA